MAEAKGITLEVGMNTDKLQLKLRAIAKHAEALANELDAIDNAVECPSCGGYEIGTLYANGEVFGRECQLCQRVFDNELPTRLEGSV